MTIHKLAFEIIIIYLGLINMAGFTAMGIDKRKAKKNAWRIPEKTLFLFPLLGGSIGGILGMYVFRHKTKHWYFRIGFVAILLLQIAAAAALLTTKTILIRF